MPWLPFIVHRFDGLFNRSLITHLLDERCGVMPAFATLACPPHCVISAPVLMFS
ncbi:hypothetical protein SynA1825c_02151 [Synechococcus sp. A18-25c]|nr:hypothetical protein SynA1825c_02151 [Synechococcus sp. A18-25c]